MEDELFEDKNKPYKKRKLHDLLDKYGTIEELEQHGSVEDNFDYMFAGQRELLDEVLEERRENTGLKAENENYDEAENLTEKRQKTAVNLQKKLLEDDEQEKQKSGAHETLPATSRSSLDDEDMAKNAAKHPMFKTPNEEDDEWILRAFAHNTRARQYAENEYSGTKSDEGKVGKEPFDMDKFTNVIMKKYIDENEGIYLYPYVDTADKISIGPGVNIDSNHGDIEWLYKDTATGKLRPLYKFDENDMKLIDKELSKLNLYKNNNQFSAKYFEDKTNLRIDSNYAHRLYLNRVNKAISNLKDLINTHNQNSAKKIDDFEKMSKPLQIVLVDMVYNLGHDGFHWKRQRKFDKNRGIYYTGYPNFWRALENKDVEGMINESNRNVSGKPLTRRNQITKEILKNVKF